MASERKQNSYLQYKIKQAHKIIFDDLSSIPDVQTWANKAGVSTRWLCKAMKNKHGNSPKLLLRKRRYTVLVKSLKKDPEITGYCLAREVGLSDEKSLYKFLSSHYETSLTQLRNGIMKERLID